ncbi:MAG: methyltransferase domain-containing protein [Oculatellaceae cyanobacterium Prado106]|jgi:SAM-dependent methyltransferase|nr:methyltransferase domain-containing protein [Oculatellaceae cyanobacterium Prado106]
MSLKIHLGAFDQGIEGWINTDVTPNMWIAKVPFAPLLLYKLKFIPERSFQLHQNKAFHNLHYLDLTKKLPYADHSVDVFFSSHVIEHLSSREVANLVQELYRCLVPGGLCRIVVPDLEKIISLYDRQDPSAFITAIYEASTRGKEDIRGNHHTAFTGPSLEKLFRSKGFSQVRTLAYQVGQCPDIDRLDNHPEESLYFEAIK